MLMYKLLICCTKIYTKIIHTIIFVCAISAITIGMVTGIQAQQNAIAKSPTAKHFYSIHAWSGLVTTALFALQFVFGFISFLVLLCCDKATAGFRKKMLPTHVTFGLVVYSLAVISCISGLMQVAKFRLTGKDGSGYYRSLGEPAIVINAVGCCMIGLAIILPYIIRNCGPKNRGSFSLN
ncbi:Cytochrome b reductase 1-like protein, partial [Dinothrombium tinctorium]